MEFGFLPHTQPPMIFLSLTSRGFGHSLFRSCQLPHELGMPAVGSLTTQTRPSRRVVSQRCIDWVSFDPFAFSSIWTAAGFPGPKAPSRSPESAASLVP